jgi:hypothetical protein
LLSISVLVCVGGSAEQGRSPGNARQNVTAGRMRTLRTCLDIYLEEHKSFPATLAIAVADLYPTPPADLLLDAWGRSFLYYRTQTSYFIGSLGRDGHFDDGAPVAESEDCDITMIHGAFARVPIYVEQ